MQERVRVSEVRSNISVQDKDEVVHAIMNLTEEARKVERQEGKKFPAVFRRIKNKQLT